MLWLRRVLGVGLLLAGGVAWGQAVVAVPKLDVDQLTGNWYEISRLPDKHEKGCGSDGLALITRGDKAHTLLLVNSCATKPGDVNDRNRRLKQDKSGDGRLKAAWVWPLTKPYWVLALADDQSWVVFALPNHKGLWVYAKAKTLDDGVLSGIKAEAAAQGFAVGSMVAMRQGK